MWIGEEPAGQPRSSFGEVPVQEVDSRTEGIGELPVRVYARVARRQVGQTVLFGEIPEVR